MTSRRLRGARTLLVLWGPIVASLIGASLIGIGCSSEELRSHADEADASGPSPSERDGDAVRADAWIDAGDAAEIEPPPYDFTVRCAGQPCVTHIAARGGAHACLILQDGAVRCWGANGAGQLGAGPADGASIPSYQAEPRPVAGISGAKSLAATGDGRTGTTCAVAGSDEVSCFGSNAWGHLALPAGPSTAPQPVPVVIDGVHAKQVTLAKTFAMAIDGEGHLWSWGTNALEQLARSTSGPDAGTGSVAAPAERVGAPVLASVGSSTFGFAVTGSRQVLSWGGASDPLWATQTPNQLGRLSSLRSDPMPAPLALDDVTSVAAGTAHACALGRGRVDCWGRNDHGQLGNGRKAPELLPVRALLPRGVWPVALSAGGDNTCIIGAKGEVYCWGANDRGQLAMPPSIDEATPAPVGGLTDESVALALMESSACALLRTGSVVCWGDNILGQLGRGVRGFEIHPQPAPVALR